MDFSLRVQSFVEKEVGDNDERDTDILVRCIRRIMALWYEDHEDQGLEECRVLDCDSYYAITFPWPVTKTIHNGHFRALKKEAPESITDIYFDGGANCIVVNV